MGTKNTVKRLDLTSLPLSTDTNAELIKFIKANTSLYLIELKCDFGNKSMCELAQALAQHPKLIGVKILCEKDDIRNDSIVQFIKSRDHLQRITIVCADRFDEASGIEEAIKANPLIETVSLNSVTASCSLKVAEVIAAAKYVRKVELHTNDLLTNEQFDELCKNLAANKALVKVELGAKFFEPKTWEEKQKPTKREAVLSEHFLKHGNILSIKTDTKDGGNSTSPATNGKEIAPLIEKIKGGLRKLSEEECELIRARYPAVKHKCHDYRISNLEEVRQGAIKRFEIDIQGDWEPTINFVQIEPVKDETPQPAPQSEGEPWVIRTQPSVIREGLKEKAGVRVGLVGAGAEFANGR